MPRKLGVARAAAMLAGLTALSQLLGFARDAVIAAVYGAGAALDAYLVAQGVMNLVLALVAGAMARAVVPTVSRAVDAGDPDRGNRTVQSALTLTFVVLLTGSVVMYLAADVVVAVLAPGFDDATADLAVDLTRIVLFAAVFIAGTDILAATAQAHGRFFHSGVQGVPFNLVMITAAAAFGARFGVQSLAVGFVVGSVARLLVQLPPVRGVGVRLRPRLGLRDADFVEVLRLAPPLLVTTAVVNVNTLVDRAVGSAQGEGVIASLSFGWRVVTLVDSLLVVTVAAALYPAFSAAGTPERRAELRELVTRSLRVMLVLLTPMVALLVVAAEPLVRLIFGRGDFDAEAVRLTSLAVTGYAVSAAAIGIRSIGSRACLAVGDGRTPVLVAIVIMVVNVAGDLTLGVAYGVVGLAAATSLSLTVGAVLLVLLVARRHRAVSARRVGVSLGRVALAALMAAAVCVVVDAPVAFGEEFGGAASPSAWATLAGLAGTTLLLFGVYVVVLWSTSSRELTEVMSVLRERLLPRRRP